MKNLLVTGGCGFIGSNFVRLCLERCPDVRLVNLDKLTYAGNLENLADIAADPRYRFVKGDIGDADLVERLFAEEAIDTVVHFAAESHVDRSIEGPAPFIQTNILGTFTLLEAARKAWLSSSPLTPHPSRFLHVSTDEVYGSLARPACSPRPPPTTRAPRTRRASGLRPPGQRLPPHLRPADADHQLLQQLRSVPLPGKAHPADHQQRPQRPGAAGLRRWQERARLALRGRSLRRHIERAGARTGRGDLQRRRQQRETEPRSGADRLRSPRRQSRSIAGRPTPPHPDPLRQRPPGHDRRYAIDATKIREELGWTPTVTFEQGIERTIDWYLANRHWVEQIVSGSIGNITRRCMKEDKGYLTQRAQRSQRKAANTKIMILGFYFYSTT